MSDKPPVKEFSPTWFSCKWCDNADICHNGADPEMNCRTCDFSDMGENGTWECNKTEQELTVDQQKAGCKKYKTGWGL